jgi:ABC-type transport system involved in multi-copper enzyme maturation permease subunit
VTWLTWRQFRTSVVVAMAGLAAVAILLAITPEGHQLARCAGADRCPFVENKVLGLSHAHLLQFLSTGLVGLPALVGVFWGAPIIAREFEAGTHRLVWTQSVTRGRWLAVKVGAVAVAGAAVCGLFSLMLTWWSPEATNSRRITPAMFAERGIVPIGYAVFALAVGVVAGLLIRRTVPAMATTLVAFLGARMAIQYLLREHLVSTKSGSLPIGSNLGISQTPSGVSLDASAANIPNGWVTSSRFVDASGHAPTRAFIQHACHLPPDPGSGTSANHVKSLHGLDTCIRTVSARFHEVVTFHPASQYWALQLAETAIFLALAAAIIGLGFWRLRVA